jgi:hypothetical protein
VGRGELSADTADGLDSSFARSSRSPRCVIWHGEAYRPRCFPSINGDGFPANRLVLAFIEEKIKIKYTDHADAGLSFVSGLILPQSVFGSELQ